MRAEEETFLTEMDDRGRIQVPLAIRKFLGIEGAAYVRITIKKEQGPEEKK